MLTLTRCVRFCVNRPGSPAPATGAPGYSGRPAMSGLGAFYELAVTCRGEADPATGYLVDIQEVDRATRAAALPSIERAALASPPAAPESILAEVVQALGRAIPGKVEGVDLRLSPYHAIAMSADRTTHVLIRQRFDFAAAHRLHVPSLSDAENVRLFGKCNNPRGHGHNYQFEPVVEVPASTGAAPAFTHADLARIGERVILGRFDHKHLNEDTEEFRAGSGLIPSVENIARVFFGLLDAALALHPGAPRLVRLTVWETDRTSATVEREGPPGPENSRPRGMNPDKSGWAGAPSP